jgi:hypothetical protein
VLAHGLRGGLRLAGGECVEQSLVLVERVLGDAPVEHQPEEVVVGVLERQHLPDQLVAGALHDAVVEERVLACEGGIAQVLVLAIAARHHAGRFAQRRELVVGHRGGRLGRAVRLEQQAQFVELVEAPAGDLRGGPVADEVLLHDQPLALQAAERLADRRVRDVEHLHQIVDGDPGPGRDFQRHQLIEDRFIDIQREAVRPSDRCTALEGFAEPGGGHVVRGFLGRRAGRAGTCRNLNILYPIRFHGESVL